MANGHFAPQNALSETPTPSESVTEMDQARARPAPGVYAQAEGALHSPEYGMLKSPSSQSLSAMARAGVYHDLANEFDWLCKRIGY